ncbi:hypothetical protein [Actinomadura opuntiae]|uniref:hypothetical protein n=1 Tax=Actinomadura sp. OS1-43 TaxID=604315 RepID=UPI00255ADF06|nr:hypothetical protein [Actinomadura sp. OS1-43]MDL4817171.1 hypothetical protein [Actinomadura sp. OS1-43]
MSHENVSATLTFPVPAAPAAPAARVFAVPADPTTKAATDGGIWGYDLTPLGPSRTEATLTHDCSAVPQYIREYGIRFPPFGPDHLINSLHHLAQPAGSAAPMSRT